MCIFTVVAVSSERCQAICHPLRRRASPGQYMIFVTILSVSLNARKFFELQHNKEGTDYETTSLMEYPPYIVFSNTWQELVVTGALPLVILLACNIKIYLKIRESSKHESHRFVGRTTNYDHSRSEYQETVAMVPLNRRRNRTVHVNETPPPIGRTKRSDSYCKATTSVASEEHQLAVDEIQAIQNSPMTRTTNRKGLLSKGRVTRNGQFLNHFILQ